MAINAADYLKLLNAEMSKIEEDRKSALSDPSQKLLADAFQEQNEARRQKVAASINKPNQTKKTVQQIGLDHQLKQSIDELGAELAANAPAHPKAVKTEDDRILQRAIDEALGIKDTITTQQKAADAQSAYDSYMGSQEREQNQKKANRNAFQEAIDRVFAVPGASMSDMPLSVAAPLPKDETQQRLKAEAGYRKAQQQAEEDRAVMDKDMAEYNAWSEEDRNNLDRYITERDRAASQIFGEPQQDTYNLNPLIQKYGLGKVRQMAESVQRSRNEQALQETRAAAEKTAQERPVLGSLASVGTNLVGAYTGPVEYIKEMGQRTGRYQTLDPNNLGSMGTQFGSGVRQGVSQSIQGEDGNWLRTIAAIGYEGVMSAADSGARLAAGGFNPGISAGLAASQNFGSSLQQYSAQGATPEQAAMAALASSGIEYLTEKIPMDELLKVGKGGKVWKDILKQTFLVEPTTEEISLFANVAAEAAILGEKSDRSQRIGELIAGGATYKEAKAQVNKELWNEAARTYAVSAVSGFAGAGGAAIGNRGTDVQVKPEVDRKFQNAIDEALGVVPSQEETTSVNTDPTEHTAREQAVIDAYQESVDNDLVDYVQLVKENPGRKLPRYPLNPVNARAAADIQRLTGIDVSGNKTEIESRTVEHILKRHGENGTANHSMRDVNDIGRIQYVIDNYDTMENGGTTSAYRYQDADGKQVHAKTVLIKKKVNGTYFVVEAVPDTKKKTLYVLSAYMNKNGQKETVPSLVGDAEAYRFTSETKAKSDTVPTNSISEPGAEVKVDVGFPISDLESGSYGRNTVGSAESMLNRGTKESKVYGNTYTNTGSSAVRAIGREVIAADPNIGIYDTVSETESLQHAIERTRSADEIEFEYSELVGKSGWSSEDNDTAMLILNRLRRDGDIGRLKALAKKQSEEATNAGQLVQSFAKYTRESTTTAAIDAIMAMEDYSEADVPKSFYKRKGFDGWKEDVAKSVLTIAEKIDAVNTGDSDSMRGIIQDIAKIRNTTAWMGYSSELTRRTSKGLAKMDFDMLKTIAKTQLSMIPSDFKKRSAAEVAKTVRIQNMLFTVTTKLRNDAGNISNGFMDAVSDSVGGRMIDALLSKVTGQRTVANDIRYANEYVKAAKDASDVAAAFVSLDIPMDIDTKYSSGKTRTFSPQTSPKNILGRMLSAFEKHLRYSLEVSDKFYEGGATHVVGKSLQNLGEKANLNDAQIAELSQKVGQRRTFKDPGKTGTGRTLARTNTGIQRALNNLGVDGFGFGDLIQPFSAVSGEVAQTSLDYSGGGLVTGLGEIISILKDARAGKQIDPYRQRMAATDFGRGMTGVALISAFAGLAAAGAIKVHDSSDYEERMAEQSRGLSGTQWNLDASIRWWQTVVNGNGFDAAREAAEWKSGDELVSLDFLDPLNAPMNIGYLLSQGEDVAAAVAQGNFMSLLDMPMMETFSDLADLTEAFTEVSDGDMDGVYDAAGQLIGNVAGSAIPNWVRKTAQSIDPYYRDTYDADPFEKAGKQLISAVPYLSTTLPEKYDAFGNPQMRFDPSNPIDALQNAVDTLVTPWDSENYQESLVYQEVERLNSIEGINVSPPSVSRKVSYTDTDGQEHKKVMLTEEQYKAMAKEQGDSARDILDGLMRNKTYQAMGDQMKAETIKLVYEYAKEQGKKKAIDNYYVDPDAWTSKAGAGTISGIIRRSNDLALNRAIDDAVKSLNNGWKVTKKEKADINEAFRNFEQMLASDREKVISRAEGETARYLDLRLEGLSTDDYLDIAKAIAGLKPEAGKKEVIDIQKWEAVAKSKKLTDREKDAAMKAYMTDYNPESSSPKTTELKYDYVRQELGISPEAYTMLYRTYAEIKDIPSAELKERNISREDEYKRKWMSLGYTNAEASLLYNLFVASGKNKIDVVSWHNERSKG